MRKIKYLLAVTLPLSLTACQGVNDVLQGVNSTLGAVNDVLGGTVGALSGSTGGGVSIDSKTQASAVSATNKAVANSSVKKLFNDAKPSIEKFVATSACVTSQSQLRRFMDPETSFLPNPLNSVSYHKSGCLNVLRINNVQKKTANAFTFTVYYISPQSEETKTYDYTAIKQPEGEWLFRGY